MYIKNVYDFKLRAWSRHILAPVHRPRAGERKTCQTGSPEPK